MLSCSNSITESGLSLVSTALLQRDWTQCLQFWLLRSSVHDQTLCENISCLIAMFVVEMHYASSTSNSEANWFEHMLFYCSVTQWFLTFLARWTGFTEALLFQTRLQGVKGRSAKRFWGQDGGAHCKKGTFKFSERAQGHLQFSRGCMYFRQYLVSDLSSMVHLEIITKKISQSLY